MDESGLEDGMSGPTITRLWDSSACLEFPYDAALIDALKAGIPVHARTYDPVAKAWMVTGRYVSVATRLMYEVFGHVDVVEQTSAGSADRDRHAGEDPWVILHLRPTAPPELVSAAHRCLAKLNHPDTGGNCITMQSINAAVDQIRGAR
jgi:hypothetical protein